MSFTFEVFQTASTSGAIVNQVAVTDIVNNFSLEKSLGNQFYIESGDIDLELYSPLPITSSLSENNWLAVYFSGELYEVFRVGLTGTEGLRDYQKKDVKRGKYKVRLQSVQNWILSELKKKLITYSAVSEDFNSAAQAAIYTLSSTKVYDGGGSPITNTNTKGFSLTYLLYSLVGKSNNMGLIVNSLEIPLALTGDDLPILHLGTGIASSATDEETVTRTFTEKGIYFIDIFKWVAELSNSFIKISPIFATGVLKVDFFIEPRKDLTAYPDPPGLEWIEIEKEKFKYRLAGVKLEGKNFVFEQGDINGEDVLSRSFVFADPSEAQSDPLEQLFLSVGDTTAAFTVSVLDGSSEPRPYLSSGLVEPYYTEVIDSGHGYAGKAEFDGVNSIDLGKVRLAAGLDAIKILKIIVDKRKIAKIEGVVTPWTIIP